MSDKLIETILSQIDSDALIEELRRRLGLAAGAAESLNGRTVSSSDAGTGREVATGVVRPDEFFRLSNPEAIRKFLGIMKRPQSPRAIVDGLKSGGVLSNSKNFYATIWTELKRASDRGEIVNTPSGWALAEWYPNRPKPPEPVKRAKKRSPTRKAKKNDGTTDVSLLRQDTPRLSDYQRFMQEARKQGKDLKQIAHEWKAHKASR